MKITNCAHCGKPMTDDEVYFLERSCISCERAMWDALDEELFDEPHAPKFEPWP